VSYRQTSATDSWFPLIILRPPPESHRVDEDSVNSKIEVRVSDGLVLRIVHPPVFPQRLQPTEFLGDVEQTGLDGPESSQTQ
jgi:hypothetical protein